MAAALPPGLFEKIIETRAQAALALQTAQQATANNAAATASAQAGARPTAQPTGASRSASRRRNSSHSSETSDEDSEDEGRAATWRRPGCPRGVFRLEAETEETIFNSKRLSELVLTFLPPDASSLRGWKNAFMATASKLDRTPHDVLAKWLLFHLSNRADAEETAASPLQGGTVGLLAARCSGTEQIIRACQ